MKPGGSGASGPPRATGQFRLRYNDTQGKEVTTMVEVAASGREMPPSDGRPRRPGRAGRRHRRRCSNSISLTGSRRSSRATLTKVTKPFESDLWDNWLTLSILILLYCVDVAAERLLGLT